MWLINTVTLNLEQVPSHGPEESEDDPSAKVRPPYAILSHRWRDDEVLYQDMHDDSIRRQRKGWQKVLSCCAKALQDGLQYAWIDSCCMNKDSATELSESINSMYRWYRDASICYLYMDDIGIPLARAFDEAEVWSRGWCLQELIAPRYLVCLDASWRLIGDRTLLQHDIRACTGIDLWMLNGSHEPHDFTVAQRMSWAANRKTTNPEDRAYSLIGLFDVSMPLLYGEGAEKAFFRLQETAIMQDNYDHSIFAWTGVNFPTHCGLLAPSPTAFAACGDVELYHPLGKQMPFSITNRGVSITLRMRPWTTDVYRAVLSCRRRRLFPLDKREGDQSICIYLRRLEEDDLYIRTALDDGQDLHSGDTDPRILAELLLHDHGQDCERHVYVPHTRLTTKQIKFCSPKIFGFRIFQSLIDFCAGPDGPGMSPGRRCTFDASQRLFIKEAGTNINKSFFSIDLTKFRTRIRFMFVFMDKDFNPVCFLAEESALYEDDKYQLNGDGTKATPPPGGWSAAITEYQQHLLERTPENQYGWNDTSGCGVQDVEKDEYLRFTTVFPQTSFRRGLWQIRGHRQDGLWAELQSVSSRADFRDLMQIRISHGLTTEGSKVWDVNVALCKQNMFDSLTRTLLGLSPPSSVPSLAGSSSEEEEDQVEPSPQESELLPGQGLC